MIKSVRRRGGGARPKLALPEAAAVLAALADPVIVLDRDGEIRMVNPAAEQFFGTGAAALQGTALAGLVAPHSPLLSLDRRRLARRQHDVGIRHRARRAALWQPHRHGAGSAAGGGSRRSRGALVARALDGRQARSSADTIEMLRDRSRRWRQCWPMRLRTRCPVFAGRRSCSSRMPMRPSAS